MSEVGSAFVRVRPNMAGFKGETERGVRSAFTGIAKTVGIALGTAEAFRFGKSLVEDAADIQKQMEGVRQVFGEAGESIIAFGEKPAASLGISAKLADTTAVRFGLLFRTLGIGHEQGAKMVVDMEKLAGAISQVRNVDPQTLFQNLPLALGGNLRALRQLGLAITQPQIKAAAVVLGLNKEITDSVTPTIRAQVIYALATGKLGDALKDAHAKSGDLANQQRKLRAEWADSKDELGAGLLPTMASATKFLADNLPDGIAKTKRAFHTLAVDIQAITKPFGGAKDAAVGLVGALTLNKLFGFSSALRTQVAGGATKAGAAALASSGEIAKGASQAGSAATAAASEIATADRVIVTSTQRAATQVQEALAMIVLGYKTTAAEVKVLGAEIATTTRVPVVPATAARVPTAPTAAAGGAVASGAAADAAAGEIAAADRVIATSAVEMAAQTKEALAAIVLGYKVTAAQVRALSAEIAASAGTSQGGVVATASASEIEAAATRAGVASTAAAGEIATADGVIVASARKTAAQSQEALAAITLGYKETAAVVKVSSAEMAAVSATGGSAATAAAGEITAADAMIAAGAQKASAQTQEALAAIVLGYKKTATDVKVLSAEMAASARALAIPRNPLRGGLVQTGGTGFGGGENKELRSSTTGRVANVRPALTSGGEGLFITKGLKQADTEIGVVSRSMTTLRATSVATAATIGTAFKVSFASIRTFAFVMAGSIRAAFISALPILVLTIAVTEIIEHWSTLKRWFIDFAGWLPRIFRTVWEGMKQMGKAAAFAIAEDFTFAVRILLKAASHIPLVGGKAKAGLEAINHLIDKLKPDFGKVADKWREGGKQVVSAFQEGITDAHRRPGGSDLPVTGVTDAGQKFIDELRKRIKNLGGQVKQAAVSGDGGVKAAREHLRDIGRQLADALKQSSTDLKEGLAKQAEDLKDGLARQAEDLAAGIKKQAEDVRNAVLSAKSNLNSLAATLSDDIARILDEPIRVAQEKISRLNNLKSLEDLRRSVLLPGSKQLSRDPATAIRELKALVAGASTLTRPAIQAFLLQYQSAHLAVKQDQVNLVKETASRQIKGLAQAFNEGQINFSTFKKRVLAVLTRDHISYKTAGAFLGSAFAAGFKQTTKDLFSQAGKVAGGPKIKGSTGLETDIVNPAKVLKDDRIELRKTLHDDKKELASTLKSDRKELADALKTDRTNVARLTKEKENAQISLQEKIRKFAQTAEKARERQRKLLEKQLGVQKQLSDALLALGPTAANVKNPGKQKNANVVFAGTVGG